LLRISDGLLVEDVPLNGNPENSCHIAMQHL
jgi:hypothetical protein